MLSGRAFWGYSLCTDAGLRDAVTPFQQLHYDH